MFFKLVELVAKEALSICVLNEIHIKINIKVGLRSLVLRKLACMKQKGRSKERTRLALCICPEESLNTKPLPTACVRIKIKKRDVSALMFNRFDCLPAQKLGKGKYSGLNSLEKPPN